MAAFSTTPNEEPVAATIRDGLKFVLTTTLTLRKDSDNELVHGHGVRVQR